MAGSLDEEGGQPQGPDGQPQGPAPTRLDCAVPDFVPVIGLAVVSGLALLTMVLVLIMTRPV